MLDTIIDFLSKLGYNPLLDRGVYSIKVPAKRTFWQWAWRSENFRLFRVFVRDDFVVLVSHDEIFPAYEFDLVDPNSLADLELALTKVVASDRELRGEWAGFLFEAHHSGCRCSYCTHRLWPFIWLPEDRGATSWRIIAGWFGRRVYVRWTPSTRSRHRR